MQAVMKGLSLRGSLPENLLGLAASESPYPCGGFGFWRGTPQGFPKLLAGGPVGQVGSSASPQVGPEAWEGSEEASLEVLEVSHLADPEVGHLVALAGGCLVGLEVDHPEDPKGGHLDVQVVDSDHLGQQEAAPEEGGKSDWYGSLG